MSSFTKIPVCKYTLCGASLAGMYTSIYIPELNCLFDVGIPSRLAAGANHLFISHAHADHVGGLVGLQGIRGLMNRNPLQTFLPEEIEEDLSKALSHMSAIQRYDLSILPVRMAPGDIRPVKQELKVRAFKTYHPVPSLGYQLFREIKKLKPEYHGLQGKAISEHPNKSSLFRVEERLELAYVTDSLVQVLDHNPSLYQSRLLIIECSFLDTRKSLEATHAGCHIHLDELLERADLFENEAIVLMHFSQLYNPREVRSILKQRLPARLAGRVLPFAPEGSWP